MAKQAKRTHTTPKPQVIRGSVKELNPVHNQFAQRHKDEAEEDFKTTFSKFHVVANELTSLKAMDIKQLVAVYDVMTHLNEILVAFMNAPRFEGEQERTYNLGGEFLESFRELTGYLLQTIIGQLRTRPVPSSYESYGDMYYETLLNYETRGTLNVANLKSLLEQVRTASSKPAGQSDDR